MEKLEFNTIEVSLVKKNFGRNVRMNFKIHEMVLSLFFALAFCFSFSIEASAHDYERSDGMKTYTHPGVEDISAADVDPADETQMKKFLVHLAKHLDMIQKDDLSLGVTDGLDEAMKQEKSREIVIFAREARQEGPFNNGDDLYVIGVTQREAITNHGLHGNLYGYKYDKSQDPLMTLLNNDLVPEFTGNTADTLCETYPYGSGNRVACAVRQPTPVGMITTITGFHHAENDPVAIPPNCDDFTFTVKAKHVEDETDLDKKKDLLKEYVAEVITTTKTLIGNTAIAVATDEGIQLPPSPGELARPEIAKKINARFYEKAPCFRKEPDLRYGSIYAFIMDPVRGVAFLSGNDFTRNGLSVSLNDPNPVPYDGNPDGERNILTLIHRTLTETPTVPITQSHIGSIAHGDSGFFRYHWAHPVKTELNNPNFLDNNEVPGKALKESYIQVENLNQDIPGTSPLLLVFGSGFYPDDLKDDDDGCSIAATGNTPQGALLNLFLIASVLFSAVFLRKRG